MTNHPSRTAKTPETTAKIFYRLGRKQGRRVGYYLRQGMVTTMPHDAWCHLDWESTFWQYCAKNNGEDMAENARQAAGLGLFDGCGYYSIGELLMEHGLR